MIKNKSSRSPLITVITVCLNAERHIEQTIQSVLAQTWRSIEYIIIDGGSIDNTLFIINRYKKQLTTFISEKDDGIADAMNKGVALAKGEFILFLHADDYFKDNHSLEDAIAYLEDSTDILACCIEFGTQRKLCKPRGFNFWTNFKTGVFHQGALCRRSLIEQLGGVDRQFRIVMDYDFFFRAYRRKATLVKAPVILTVMRDSGISTRQDWESLEMRFAEERKVHTKNTSSVCIRLLYEVYWFFYLPYRKLVYARKKGRRG
jgi:glycosyltransferase involved in cell wall biosynthesis